MGKRQYRLLQICRNRREYPAFKQFLIGSYFQNFARNVGPGVPESPNVLFYTSYSYKQDKVTSGSVLIGFASPTPHNMMLSFLVGPSLNKCTKHSGF